jgi:hypothetical protein
MSSPPTPQMLRQRLLATLAQESAAMTTAGLRRCLSVTFGQDVIHERIYHNLQVLERRGEVTRTTAAMTGGRNTLWRLNQAHQHSRGRLSS